MSDERRRIPRWQIILMFLVVVVFFTGVGWGLWRFHASHPKVVIPEENRRNFARVAVLLDGTPSIHTEDFAVMKTIVQEKIIPNLGVNDVVLAFDVRPVFSLDKNRIFGSIGDGDQPPPVALRTPCEILNSSGGKGKGAAAEELYGLVREVSGRDRRMRELRSGWAARVAALRPSREKGSDICDPLRELAHFLISGDSRAEKWLFVLSDLQNESADQVCRSRQSFPPGTRVVLIYPFGPDDPKGRTSERFWRDLFGDREVESFSFSALAGKPLLPPNPTAGLEKIELPG